MNIPEQKEEEEKGDSSVLSVISRTECLQTDSEAGSPSSPTSNANDGL